MRLHRACRALSAAANAAITAVATATMLAAAAAAVAGPRAVAAAPAASVASAARAPTALPALRITGPLPAPADFIRPFEDPFPLRVRRDGNTTRVELRHCQDWLDQRSAAVGSDNDAAWRVVLQQTVPCEALAWLAAARTAQRSALPADLSQLRDTRVYPGALWPTPSPQQQSQLMASGRHLGQASGVARFARTPVAPATTPPQGQLGLRTAAWLITLTPLARGDIDGDGWEDAAYLWQAQSRQGSFSDARLVVLTRTAPGARLQVLTAAASVPR